MLREGSQNQSIKKSMLTEGFQNQLMFMSLLAAGVKNQSIVCHKNQNQIAKLHLGWKTRLKQKHQVLCLVLSLIDAV